MHNIFAMGICVVKSLDMANNHVLTHTDALSLAIFCKDASDWEELKGMLRTQSVGKLI